MPIFPLRFRDAMVFSIAAFLLIFHSIAAQGSVLLLPPSVAPETLSEAVPMAFAPVDFSTEDFKVEWQGASAAVSGSAPAGVKAALEAGSLDWVRVSEVLVIPRARLVVRAERSAGVISGTVRYGGFIQPFVIEADGSAEVRIPVALVSGDEYPIEIAVDRGARATSEKRNVLIRYNPRSPAHSSLVLLDPSCSRFGVSTEWRDSAPPASETPKSPNWAYMGCRLVYTEAENYRTASLEVIVFWDNVGQTISVAGVPTRASSSSVWPLRLRSEPGHVDLGVTSGGHAGVLRLSYRIPQRLHRGNLALGLGPYSFSFNSPDSSETVRSWTVMPTLYASFFVNETMRIVAFDATTLNSQFISDFGVYFSTEYMKAFDRRITINLMLGLHSIGFRTQGRYYLLPGAPQGFEVIISDFLARARNLTLGGFIYPSIQGKSYYNTWIRWGSGALFGEVNYISWQEQLDSTPYSSSSLGLTIGMPLPMLGFL